MVTKFVLKCLFLVMFIAVAAASLAVAQPTITHVSKITTQQFQTISIMGNRFGEHEAYTGDSDFISVEDQTANPGWQAGYAPYNDTVTLIVQKWSDSKIVLGGFSGQWGEYDYTLAIGDSVQIQVWDPQTGVASTPVTVTVVGEQTTTTLTSSPNPSADHEAVTFTADVSSSGGAPPDGETVKFMAGKTELGTDSLSSGSAVFVISKLKVGTTPVTAVYVGDTVFSASKSTAVNQVVQ
jgi:hypothetical protein